MQPASSIQQHPASVDAYIRHGWALVPIPHGTKGPTHKGWNLKENILRNQSDLLPGYGIGLAHAYSGTMALDIDYWDRAAFELGLNGIDLQALYDAPDAVVVDTGRAGHGKLLYAMPEGVSLRSKKLMDTDPNTNNRYNYIDFRCATADGLTMQDVMPPSIHPDTHQPYRWGGRGHWTRLPIIDPTLLAFWQSLLAKDEERIIPSGDALKTSWEEIQQALSHISPDCSRDEWVHVGMALQWAGSQTNQPDQALYLWNEWSKGSEAKYPGEGAIVNQWRSFKPDKVQSVKLGTLFHYARKGGWERPAMDVSALFSQADNPIDPDDIYAGIRPMPPEMNMALWPEVLRRRAQEISVGMGCDPLVPLFAGLASISGAVDARMRLRLMEDFNVPPVVWCMTIGDPAEKKSPGSKPMYKEITLIEDEAHPQHTKDHLVWEGKQAAYLAAKKAFIAFNSSPDAMLHPEGCPEVMDLPPEPARLRIIITDITSQKMVRQAADQPRGLYCVLDEMRAWCAKLTDKSSGEDRSAWVVSYEADRYEMDRVNAGSIHCENLAVSIYGNIQPTVFKEMLPALAQDGLIQRFIPAPLRRMNWGKGEPVPEYMTNKPQWAQTVRIAYSLPVQTYQLSPEAFTLFREFQDWYIETRQEEREVLSSDMFLTAFGKLEGTAGRLALLFHLIESPFSMTVSGDVMRRVVALVKGYIVPAFRYALAEHSEVDSFDRWLVDHIIHNFDKPTMSMADIKAAGRRYIGKLSLGQQDPVVIGSMAILEAQKWVMRLDDGSRENQHIAHWAINPALLPRFRNHRKRVIAIRQRRREEVYKQSTVGVPPVRGYLEE